MKRILTIATLIAVAAGTPKLTAQITSIGETPVTTMTCTSGGKTALTLPLFEVNVSYPGGTASASFAGSYFSQMATLQAANTAFDECSFNPGNGVSLETVFIKSVSAETYALESCDGTTCTTTPSINASATLTYTQLVSGGQSLPAVAGSAGPDSATANPTSGRRVVTVR